MTKKSSGPCSQFLTSLGAAEKCPQCGWAASGHPCWGGAADRELVAMLKEKRIDEGDLVFVEEAPRFDLAFFLAAQRLWSCDTFGPPSEYCIDRVLAHLKKELREARNDPQDVEEWVDLILLSFDGAYRAGFSVEEVIDALRAKAAKNRARDWPDWRGAPRDRPIEHVKKHGVSRASVLFKKVRVFLKNTWLSN